MRSTTSLLLSLLCFTAPTAALAADTPKLDVLFVIDNSGSMAEEQEALAAAFPQFMATLTAGMGGLPDLHVGVVSSNVGAGGFNLPGCAGAGDNGALLVPAAGACPVPNGRFISDEVDGTGARVRNYTGTLEENFACMAKIGVTGCGFEQHFESMKRALDGSNPLNAGFLRPDAYLAVVFVADEDDCSAENPSMYDPSQNELSSPLGPLNSFRCSEFGITCNEGDLARAPGSYTGCVPRSGSHVRHPQAYVDFLKGLKADPSMVLVVTIVGDPEPVSVGTDMDGTPLLNPACTGANGSAAPSVRFRAFAEQFPARHHFSSLCATDLTEAANGLGELLGGAVSGTLPDAGPVPGTPDAAPEPEPDAGVSAGADAAVGGGGDDDGADGCGCRAGAASTLPGGAGLLLLGAALALAIGRSRRRGSH